VTGASATRFQEANQGTGDAFPFSRRRHHQAMNHRRPAEGLPGDSRVLWILTFVQRCHPCNDSSQLGDENGALSDVTLDCSTVGVEVVPLVDAL
jgi:hypothetical protein